jgi:hypothetical protein
VFRSRSQDSPANTTSLAEPEGGAKARDPQAPKGRPTPKRSEAQANRRVRVSSPKDRKAAALEARAQRRAEREKQRAALLGGGGERDLPARDQGPVRRFARDYIDSRFTVAEWFLPTAVLIMVLSVIPNPTVQLLSFDLWIVIIVGILVDSVRHGVGLRKQLREQFPDRSQKGAVPYALMRTLQMRRLRLPKPQVARGAKP